MTEEESQWPGSKEDLGGDTIITFIMLGPLMGYEIRTSGSSEVNTKVCAVWPSKVALCLGSYGK